jgi:glycosyltransferase involved in cell wall biosynthesis
MLGKPTLLKVAMANSDLAFARQGRLTGRLNRLFVRQFDGYIATTEAIAAEFGDRRLDVLRVRHIPNGVDTDVFTPIGGAARAELRRRLGLRNVPIVTCVAIINERKNIDGVLRIWHRAVAAGASGHLVLVGPVHTPGGPFYHRLLQYVADHRLGDRVSFVGKQEPVVEYLQASDLFLFPSRQEGMPNSVLEAMACGVPCIVSGSAGTEQIVADGKNGYARPVADEAAFAEALLTLLADDNLRRRFSLAARDAAVANFSLEQVAKRYWALYHQLLAGAASVAD